MLHPSYNKWTRNLLVASAFDLQLREDRQGCVPPFRGSYQTSIFWATLCAFHPDLKPIEWVYPPKPRLFEIGRQHAIDITPDDRLQGARGSWQTCIFGTAGQKCPSETDPVNQGYPPPTDFPQASLLNFLIFLFSIFLLLFISLRGLNRHYLAALAVSIVIVIIIPLLLYFYSKDIFIPAEKHVSWSEGVSIWPKLLLLLFAIVLSWSFFFISFRRLRQNSYALSKKFCLLPCAAEIDGSHLQDGLRSNPPISLVGSRLRGWLNRIDYKWSFQDDGRGSCMNGLWQEYLRRQTWNCRLFRLLVLLFLYLAVCLSIIIIGPKFPVRGAWSSPLNIVTLILVLSFLSLTLFVFDATKLCWRFVSLTLDCQPRWSPETLQCFGWYSGLPSKWETGLGFWLLIQLIARHTEVVGKLIFYPFIIWLIIFVSQLEYFDNYHMHLNLVLIISLGALYAWSSAFILRRSAERLRRTALDRLSTNLTEASVEVAASPGQREYLESMIHDIETTRRGAFAPYLQNPVIQTLIVPFGGIGGLHLLDLLSKIK